jgi:hypothetical protein
MAACVPVKSLHVLFFTKTMTNVKKTHPLTPGIGTAIFGEMEPHCAATIFRLELSIRENRDYEVRQAALQEKLKTVSAEKISISLQVLMSYNLFFLCQLRFGVGGGVFVPCEFI